MPDQQAAPAYPGGSVKRAPSNYDESMVHAFHDNARAFDNLRRYATSIERAQHSAISELLKLQKQRRIQEIGSVSQKSVDSSKKEFAVPRNSLKSAIVHLSEYEHHTPGHFPNPESA